MNRFLSIVAHFCHFFCRCYAVLRLAGLLSLAVQLSPVRSSGPPAPPTSASLPRMRVRELVRLQLYNGDTGYSGELQGGGGYVAKMAGPRMVELAAMVRGQQGAVEELVGMRGKQVQLPRSDLELACDPDPRQQDLMQPDYIDSDPYPEFRIQL